MFWIDKNDIAHHVDSFEDISENDYYNVAIIIEEDKITDRYGNGNKKFIIHGVGRYKPAIQEIVSANSLLECRYIVEQKHKERLAENSLLCIMYYEVA